MAKVLSMNRNALCSPPPDNPKVIGVFGVPGSGKSKMMLHLKNNLNSLRVTFFEGSEVIARQAGSLEAFKNSSSNDKLAVRERAIRSIQHDCTDAKTLGIVTGHFSFWPEASEDLEEVITKADLEIYTHILYLDIPADEVKKRVENDTDRPGRDKMSTTRIHLWQEEEKRRLRELCYQNGILFSLVQDNIGASHLINTFDLHDENYNTAVAVGRVDEIIGSLVILRGIKPDTMLVIDGDKTLAAEDTGKLFWKQAANDKPDPLRSLFQAAGYTYTSFCQATLLYKEVGSEETFDTLYDIVASQVTVHPEFINLLQKIAKNKYVGAVVLTCGLQLVWQRVLTHLGLADMIRVIGSGPELSGCVVTPDVKGVVVKRLQDFHKVNVLAFGDSPLDLCMLQQADQALIVVGEQGKRSKSMDAELKEAIDNGGLQARQVLLPPCSSPRLDTSKLPVIKLADLGFVQALAHDINLMDATNRAAAKLLMTPTRNATVSGVALVEAHRLVGRYLATEFIADRIGVQEIKIRHVQGGLTSGHRLFDEGNTTIVALMRGGEPMAHGVWEVFPLCVFLHAKNPEDVKLKHVERRSTVILVDSVVNNGKTVADFVQHIRKLRPTIRVVVVAGVVQAGSLHDGTLLTSSLAEHGSIDLVALRISENKYAGKGGTDTGARLFNTTDLEK